MKYGIICPTSDLQKFACRSDYHLVLAHMVEFDEHYASFYRERSECGDFVTLDNSSYEIGDGAYSPSSLVQIGRKVRANETMAPEVFQNGKETAVKILEFCEEVKHKIKIFGVIHGTTVDEILTCFKAVYQRVDTIGLSCRLGATDVLIPSGNESMRKARFRFVIVNQLFRMIKEEQLDVSHLNFHLLGLNSPVELLWYGDEIRSCDSSCAYISGEYGIKLRDIFLEDYQKPANAVIFDNPPVSVETEKIVSDNIDFIKSLMEKRMGSLKNDNIS